MHYSIKRRTIENALEAVLVQQIDLHHLGHSDDNESHGKDHVQSMGPDGTKWASQ